MKAQPSHRILWLPPHQAVSLTLLVGAPSIILPLNCKSHLPVPQTRTENQIAEDQKKKLFLARKEQAATPISVNAA